MDFFRPSPPESELLRASHDGLRPSAASPLSLGSTEVGSPEVCCLRKARNSPGASSGCRWAGTQNRPSPPPVGTDSVTSSLDEYEVAGDENASAGGRSGSRARSPGPAAEPDRRRRFLRVRQHSTLNCPGRCLPPGRSLASTRCTRMGGVRARGRRGPSHILERADLPLNLLRGDGSRHGAGSSKRCPRQRTGLGCWAA